MPTDRAEASQSRAHTTSARAPHADAYVPESMRQQLRAWDASERATCVRFATTSDGWHIALSRYGGAATRAPVVLVPGLGANRFTFDLDRSVSLASYLTELGFDVFTIELRGHGRSEKRLARWTFYDYVERDLPAALALVDELAGGQAHHAIGHSMGAVALLGAIAAGYRPRSLVTLGGAVDYSGTPSVFHGTKRLLPLTHWLPRVPLGAFSRTLAPIAHIFDNPIDRVNVVRDNVDIGLYRRLTAVGFHDLSPLVLRDLAGALEPGGMRTRSGKRYLDLVPKDLPILSVSGSADPQCSPEAAARHATESRVLGKEHGCARDYGHFDCIMGRNASREAWPLMRSWIERHAR